MAKKEPLYPHVPKGRGKREPSKEEKMAQVVRETAAWIDTDVIAQSIVEGLDEEDMDITLENAQTVWLDILEHYLTDDVFSAIKYKWG